MAPPRTQTHWSDHETTNIAIESRCFAEVRSNTTVEHLVLIDASILEWIFSTNQIDQTHPFFERRQCQKEDATKSNTAFPVQSIGRFLQQPIIHGFNNSIWSDNFHKHCSGRRENGENDDGKCSNARTSRKQSVGVMSSKRVFGTRHDGVPFVLMFQNQCHFYHTKYQSHITHSFMQPRVTLHRVVST